MVKFVVWNKHYSVYVDTMDEHHRRFIGYLNDLYDAVREDKGVSVIQAVADEFHGYTRFHFKSEEELLSQNMYPELAAKSPRCAQIIELIEQQMRDYKRI